MHCNYLFSAFRYTNQSSCSLKLTVRVNIQFPGPVIHFCYSETSIHLPVIFPPYHLLDYFTIRFILKTQHNHHLPSPSKNINALQLTNKSSPTFMVTLSICSLISWNIYELAFVMIMISLIVCFILACTVCGGKLWLNVPM